MKIIMFPCEFLVCFVQYVVRAQRVIEDRDVTAAYTLDSISYSRRGVVSQETVFQLVAAAACQRALS